MKIIPDIGVRTPSSELKRERVVTPKEHTIKKKPENISPGPGQWNTNNITSLRDQEIRLSEALSIHHMAQKVINRALEISHRLKNMAIESIHSKRPSYEELTAVSSELKTSLDRYSDLFAATILPPAPELPSAPELKYPQPAMINTDMSKGKEILARIDRDLGSGNTADNQSLYAMIGYIESKKEELDNYGRYLNHEFSNITANYKTDVNSNNAFQLVKDTGAMISGKHDSAFMAHGRLSGESLLISR